MKYFKTSKTVIYGASVAPSVTTGDSAPARLETSVVPWICICSGDLFRICCWRSLWRPTLTAPLVTYNCFLIWRFIRQSRSVFGWWGET